MAKRRKKPEFRHPDTVAYLRSLNGEEKAVHPPAFRAHGDGFTRYWLEDGEVRCRDVTAAGLPSSGAGVSALETLLSAARERFGDLMPKLAAEAGRPVPDLDSIGRALRDGSHASGAMGLKAILEDLDRRLPGPVCGNCGKTMAWHLRESKTLMTRLGQVTVERVCRYCRECGHGHFPLDRALGLEGGSHTPGAASLMADVVGDSSFEEASRKPGNLAGVTIPPSTMHRRCLKIGARVQRFEQEAVEPGAPAAARMCLSMDGAGVPVRKSEVKGVRGKQADGSAKTREAKVLTICAAGRVHPETSDPEKDPGSGTHSGLIDSAAAVGGVSRRSAFAGRLEREITRQGLREAAEVVTVSDAASWIRSVCGELLPGRKVTFILDLWHALEYAGAALRALVPDTAERKARLEAVKADLKAGKVDEVIAALRPHRHTDSAAAKCVDYFTANKSQMQYDKYRRQGMQIGSGVVESACRQIVGLRLKRPGSHWSVQGANAVLSIKCCLTNHRWVDFLDWKAQQAVAA